jgi:UDP-N-acetylmuramate dehydrogenase
MSLDLFRHIQGEVRFDEPMRRHSSFRIGGPADVFVSPAGVDDLCTVLREAGECEMPVTIIGAGTNLLVSDEGIRGCVIKIGRGLGGMRREGERVIAGAGAPIAKVARWAAGLGLSGLEFAEGIPGSVGGAVTMNAGAHGSDISCVLEEVQVADKSGQLFNLPGSQLELGYRTSVIRTEHEFTVTAATFQMTTDTTEAIFERMQAIGERRRRTQPLGQACAGSIFKNPPGDYAARLIESCGLKGLRINDAMVSPVHANFIVNVGNAKAVDVIRLIETVRQRVLDDTGVHLQLELEIIGLEGH